MRTDKIITICLLSVFFILNYFYVPVNFNHEDWNDYKKEINISKTISEKLLLATIENDSVRSLRYEGYSLIDLAKVNSISHSEKNAELTYCIESISQKYDPEHDLTKVDIVASWAWDDIPKLQYSDIVILVPLNKGVIIEKTFADIYYYYMPQRNEIDGTKLKLQNIEMIQGKGTRQYVAFNLTNDKLKGIALEGKLYMKCGYAGMPRRLSVGLNYGHGLKKSDRVSASLTHDKAVKFSPEIAVGEGGTVNRHSKDEVMN